MGALIDTNILIYRYDLRFPGKQEIATGILRRGIVDGSVCLPHQAIIEFVAVATRPIRGHAILERADALREAEELLKQFVVLYPNEAIVREAVRGCAAYRLSWSMRICGRTPNTMESRRFSLRIFSMTGFTDRSVP